MASDVPDIILSDTSYRTYYLLWPKYSGGHLYHFTFFTFPVLSVKNSTYIIPFHWLCSAAFEAISSLVIRISNQRKRTRHSKIKGCNIYYLENAGNTTEYIHPDNSHNGLNVQAVRGMTSNNRYGCVVAARRKEGSRKIEQRGSMITTRFRNSTNQ